MTDAELCHVDLRRAEAQLPELVQRAEHGEQIVITRVGRRGAKLIPLPKDFPDPIWEGEILLRADAERVGREPERLFYAPVDPRETVT